VGAFDKFDVKKEPSEGQLIDGMFQCTHLGCFEVSYDATLYDDDGIIVWKCSEGHKSSMKSYL
jgi:hypothetical protein